MSKWFLTVLLAAPFSETAGVVFFDDFEGDELGGHWQRGGHAGWGLEYEVRDSLLIVTRVYDPAPPSWFVASLGQPLADWELTARIGWDPGESQELLVHAVSEFSPGFFFGGEGGVHYRKRAGNSPVVLGWFTGGVGEIPAPPSGMHEIRIVKVADHGWVYFNDELFFEVTGLSLPAMQYVGLGFNGPDSPDFAPLYVDWIRVVPEPGTLVVLGAALVWLCRRRRS
ncbi:MAG: PEP-CTERM sorting domain-containing protein [Armatimonadetes bacterium]|nr:PEP-CTERM sorting domain-containing protein [Armatimonadota bacterium]